MRAGDAYGDSGKEGSYGTLFHAGNEVSGGIGWRRVNEVDGTDGRGFRQAVAFAWNDAEFFPESGGKVFRQFFRANDQVADGFKGVRFAAFHETAQEGGRGDYQTDSVLLDKGSQPFGLKRGGIGDHVVPADHRIP